MTRTDPLTIHATAVAVAGQAAMFIGASGSGKSSLALEMMARGADLVADDRVIVTRESDSLWVSCPDPLRGRIEARGLGILHARSVDRARLAVVVDMDQTEQTRMPPERSIEYLNVKLPLLHNVASQHFPAALIQYLKSEAL
ncbi:HPr kinase/phosphorylase [Marivita hallyeonensis]|uniref:Hpr(Ser) kinase/phosphatase n=1 Tax=Marivita hallyeonensis TaxID=996342 RepID=A0A1M5WZ89_9RHOB|nr:HPr kinase/phosphatase C-terminal domain-containing protein [Marivita hallyeonensis]SHH92618.1 Hpr(Ser) kinase/phosphatase [Marivita hallyeonensis]